MVYKAKRILSETPAVLQLANLLVGLDSTLLQQLTALATTLQASQTSSTNQVSSDTSLNTESTSKEITTPVKSRKRKKEAYGTEKRKRKKKNPIGKFFFFSI